MADRTTEVALIFTGVDNLSSVIDDVSKKTLSMSSSVQSVAGPVADVSTSLLQFEAALLASGIAVTAYSVSVARDFEQGFREVTTLIDAPVEALGDFRQAILDYASGSTASLESITGAVYSAISAGIDYTDSLEFVRQAEQLALAGNADLNESLVGLVSTLNAYGLGADEAARFSDILFTTVRLGQTTLPELNASLASVTGLAATAGISFEEVAAAVATLTATGTPTSQAITQIQGAISAILKPSSDAVNLAEELGLQFNLQRLEAVGLEGILQDVQSATGGNAEQMARLFGRVEALNGVLTLTGLGAEKFADNLIQIRDATGAAEEGALKFEGIISRTGNALKLFFIELGTPFLDEFAAGMDAVNAIINAFGASLADSDGLGALRDVVERYAQELVTVLQAAAENLPAALEAADFSGFEQGLTVVVESIRALFGGIDLGTVDGLVAAIELVGTGFLALSTFTAGVIDALSPFFSAVASAIPAFISLAESLAPYAGTLGGIAIAANTLLPAFDSLLLLVIALSSGGAFAGLGTAIGVVATALSGPVGLTILAGAAVTSLIAFTGAGDALGSGLTTLAQRITGTANVSSDLEQITLRNEAATDALVEEIRALNAEYQAALSRGADVSIGLVNQAEEYERTGKAVNLTADELDALTEQLGIQQQIQALVIDTTGELADATESAADSVGELASSSEDAELRARGVVRTYQDGVAVFTQVSKGIQDTSRSLEDLAESGDIAADKYAELRTELEKEEIRARVEFDIAELEANTELAKAQIQGIVDIAQIKATIEIADIEAETERIIAAFGSIDNTVIQTSDTIRSLADALVGIDDADKNAREKIRILEDVLDRQLSVQEAAVDSQIRLNDAIIDDLRARADRLRQGDALIQIDGAGLQPELEAFMFRILENVQIRASAEGQEFLLGI